MWAPPAVRKVRSLRIKPEESIFTLQIPLSVPLTFPKIGLLFRSTLFSFKEKLHLNKSISTTCSVLGVHVRFTPETEDCGLGARGIFLQFHWGYSGQPEPLSLILSAFHAGFAQKGLLSLPDSFPGCPWKQVLVRILCLFNKQNMAKRSVT